MKNPNKSALWIKAAVVGSIWAGSEIVVGSFLHNLKIPFRSQILTAIAIILVIAVVQKWNDKGLIWRSGLIAAIMKSISPSTVIFGPMIAIFMEALLIEFSIRVFRQNRIAYLIAGALAMSWNFFHFVFSQIIMYGYQFVMLYNNIVNFIKKQTSIVILSPINVLIFFLFAYLLTGAIAAFLGILIGKSANNFSIPMISSNSKNINFNKKTSSKKINYSIYWLIFNFIVILGIFTVLFKMQWFYWIAFSTPVLIIWFWRYPSNFKRILKPFFVISLILISLTTVVITYISSDVQHLQKSILAASEMCIRAIVLVLGFSTIGVELKNPKISNFFTVNKFSNIKNALQIGFDTLPEILSSLPPVRYFFKKPIISIKIILSYIDFWFNKAEFKIISKKNVVVVTGQIKSGKSTLLEKIIKQTKESKLKPAGIISPAIIEQEKRKGYMLIDLISDEQIVLSTIIENKELIRVGSYFFYPQSIENGKKWLQLDYIKNFDFVVIDEIGPWELKQHGWASSLNDIVRKYKKPVILVVRNSILDRVIDYWGFSNPLIINVEDNFEISEIVDFLKN